MAKIIHDTFKEETIETEFAKFGVIMHKDDIEKLDLLAFNEGSSRSEIVRDLLKKYLQEVDFSKMKKPNIKRKEKTHRLVVEVPNSLVKILNARSLEAGVKRAALVREYLMGMVKPCK